MTLVPSTWLVCTKLNINGSSPWVVVCTVHAHIKEISLEVPAPHEVLCTGIGHCKLIIMIVIIWFNWLQLPLCNVLFLFYCFALYPPQQSAHCHQCKSPPRQEVLQHSHRQLGLGPLSSQAEQCHRTCNWMRPKNPHTQSSHTSSIMA